jgi:serine/threonine-protein kinase
MEYVRGESLSRLIRAAANRGDRVPPEMSATIMVGALHGLHAAHEAKNDHGEPLGIVHRDVSPHNILVGSDGVARVLDFGVAKAAGRLQTTRDGQLKGKLAYMAPEQVRGEVSRTTDVYSASVVLWEALTGRRLFTGSNDAEILHRVLSGCQEPPSVHVPGLSPAMDALTMRGLSVDPEKRFATARDMARALEEVTPLATVSRVGDWVEAVAKETLDERSARIATMESNSSMQLPMPAPPPAPALSSLSGSFPPPVTQPTWRGSNTQLAETSRDVTVTQLSSGSVTSPGRAILLGGHLRRRTQLIAASAGAVVIVAGIAVAFSRRPSPSPLAASPPPPDPTWSVATMASLPTPPPSGTAVASGTTAFPAAPTNSSAPSAAAMAALPAVRAHPAPPPQVHAAAPTATVAPPPSCSVVTNYDAEGQPHFKKVCK